MLKFVTNSGTNRILASSTKDGYPAKQLLQNFKCFMYDFELFSLFQLFISCFFLRIVASHCLCLIEMNLKQPNKKRLQNRRLMEIAASQKSTKMLIKLSSSSTVNIDFNIRNQLDRKFIIWCQRSCVFGTYGIVVSVYFSFMIILC